MTALRRRSTAPAPAGYFLAPKDHIDWFSSGCKVLDLALGGGWAAPYIINVVGDKSSGKTLLAIEASINFCAAFAKGTVVYKRAERAFDARYAGALGMPLDRVDLGTESSITVEGIFDELEALCRRRKPQPMLYVIDSWDAVKIASEAKHGLGHADYGRKALLVSELMRRLEAPMQDSRITLMLISQVRENIGALFKSKRRSGGEAINFYASQIVWLLPMGVLVRETSLGGSTIKRATGRHIVARVEKNKMGFPNRRAYFDVIDGYGVDDTAACLKFLKDHGGGADLNGARPNVIAATIRSHAENWEECRALLHNAVETRWWEIERRFAPAAGKYAP